MVCFPHTGLEMINSLAFGAASAQALARSLTMEALVLNKSIYMKSHISPFCLDELNVKTCMAKRPCWKRMLPTITSHSWLSWDTSWDDNNVRPSDGLLQVLRTSGISLDLLKTNCTISVAALSPCCSFCFVALNPERRYAQTLKSVEDKVYIQQTLCCSG